MSELTDAQLLRYSRQIMLPSMDIDGQEALWNSRVLVIGLGGLGCAASQYLASAGVGQLTLVDDDRVELSNLQRQILHGEADVGQNKVESARQSLSQLNSEIQIQTLDRRPEEEQLAQLVESHHLVLDCTDNLSSRNRLNRLCHQYQTPLVSGAGIRMEGQVISFTMAPDSPCYACVSRYFEAPQLSCSESGVLAPVIGIIGSIQATEAIKLLSGIGQPLDGRLLLMDAASMSFQEFTIASHPDCPVCHS